MFRLVGRRNGDEDQHVPRQHSNRKKRKNVDCNHWLINKESTEKRSVLHFGCQFPFLVSYILSHKVTCAITFNVQSNGCGVTLVDFRGVRLLVKYTNLRAQKCVNPILAPDINLRFS